MKKNIIFGATLASLGWTLYLMVAVALNHISIAPRVAGGQLHTFSSMLRITYGVEAIIVIFQFFFLFQLFKRGGVWSNTSFLLARIFLILSALSAVVNLASKSSPEHWNTIPALAIAYGYLVLGALNFRPRRRSARNV